jgi:hypothetical protein
VREGVDLDGCGCGLVDVGQTSKGVGAIDVHGARAADALAATGSGKWKDDGEKKRGGKSWVLEGDLEGTKRGKKRSKQMGWRDKSGRIKSSCRSSSSRRRKSRSCVRRAKCVEGKKIRKGGRIKGRLPGGCGVGKSFEGKRVCVQVTRAKRDQERRGVTERRLVGRLITFCGS